MTSLDEVVNCVRLQHQCQADRLIENEMPRFRELLGVVGAILP